MSDLVAVMGTGPPDLGGPVPGIPSYEGRRALLIIVGGPPILA